MLLNKCTVENSSSCKSIAQRPVDSVPILRFYLKWREKFYFLRVRRRTRRALISIDDYLLKDSGITRGEADAELAKPFWRN